MSTDVLWLIGAGGHARVVMDCIDRCGLPVEVRLVDTDPSRWGQVCMGRVIGAQPAPAEAAGAVFHVAIGSNPLRATLAEQSSLVGMLPLTLQHPQASVAMTACLGRGVFVAAQAVIGPMAAIGDGCIINHGAVVDHDCQVEAYCHVAPNATLGGGVRVGAGSLLGAGCTVLPGVKVGRGCTVGAGAVVTRDLADGATAVGVPARNWGK